MTLTVVHPDPGRARVASSLVTAVRLQGSRTIVCLEGDADLSARSLLSDVLSLVIATRAGDVVIDLSELGFIDSSCTEVFAVSQEWLDRQGRALSFRRPSSSSRAPSWLHPANDRPG